MVKALPVILLLFTLLGCQEGKEVDILITNGKVFDGSDTLAKPMDIAVCGELICGVSPAGEVSYKASKTIDAKNQIVTPGFIDPHTHAYAELISNDLHQNLNYLFQGVTTVVVGNDGDGPVDIDDALGELNSDGIGTNVAMFIGHGSLRRKVIGEVQRHTTAEEMQQMAELLDTAMQKGALGISSGLYYVPGSFAATEEVIAMAKVAAKYQGVYDTHLRDESTFNIGFLAALDEAIDIAQQADIHLHVAHIKALGVDVWGQSHQAIEKINNAKAEGISISADQYPWQASGTNIRSAVVPKWAMADSDEAFIQRIDAPEYAQKIREQIKENIRRRGGADALLITASKFPEQVGRTLEELATQWEVSDTEAVVRLVKNSQLTRVASFNMNMGDIRAFMTQPWVVTSSDGTNGHPRKYASFPKKYQKYVKEDEVVSLQSFIHRSTGKTAGILGLSDRGYLREGYKADVLVFEPSRFTPKASFKQWNVLSEGVSYLTVNGQLAIADGQYTQALAGQFAKRQR
ncbi:amidohydrolase [Alteromonadaceae bacterium M269]|nr:amidohydrolase [Alteromonadaceae bacterium M269]